MKKINVLKEIINNESNKPKIKIISRLLIITIILVSGKLFSIYTNNLQTNENYANESQDNLSKEDYIGNIDSLATSLQDSTSLKIEN